MGLLKKITHIAEGFKNYVFENEQIERIAEQRAAICAACPKVKKYSLYKFIGQYGCSVCKCAVAAKVRSLEEQCPHPDGARWEAVKLPTKAVQDIPKEQPKR